jgi:hypothetical protein
MSASLVYLEQDGSGPAALKIIVPQSDVRIATHFIALIDVSESMQDMSKLTHVKHCMSLLLKFLTPDDALSLIAFGSESEIILNRVKAVPAQIPVLEQAIESLAVHGCTNYSAGLASVRQVLDDATNCTLKTGLLTLTDGHANRGVSDPASLTAMISRIHELYPTLAFSFVAYGTDHNAGLLKAMADTAMGSYSIVSDLEGAATAMGDCLGGIISCAVQNVVINCPVGTTAHGPYTLKDGRLVLGDLYAGTETTILLETVAGPVTFSGVTLPDLNPFTQVVDTSVDTTPSIEIEVTRLRYKCSDLFRQIREVLASRRTPDFDTKIAEFRAAINAPFLVNHPVIPMLNSELASIEAAIDNIRVGRTEGLATQLTQHAAFTSLMRGMTTSIESQGGADTPRNRTHRVRFNSSADPEIEPHPAILLSPTSSSRQSRITALMREASQGGADAADSQEPV